MVSIEQLFSNGRGLAPQVHLSMSADSLGCHNSGEGGCAPGIWWRKARGAAKHPMTHKTLPTARIYSSRNRNSAEAEKPWFRLKMCQITPSLSTVFLRTEGDNRLIGEKRPM